MPQQLQQFQAFIPMILLFIVFYFLIIRPQQKRQKDHQNLVSNLKVNDQAVTIGGVYGKVVKVKDNTFILRIAEKVEIEVEKSAIAKKVNE